MTDLLKKIGAALQGSKTYIILIAIWVLLLVSGGDVGSLDAGRVVSDPSFALETLGLALAGAFRSALDKLKLGG